MKINLCAGGNILDGWDNRDMDCDIRNALPYLSSSVEFVLLEHGIEHVTPQQAWNCLTEIHRILRSGGVARVCIPDISRIWRLCNAEYMSAANKANRSGCIHAALFEHGHQGAWTAELLEVVMQAVGFTTERCNYGESKHLELSRIDGHHHAVGLGVAVTETGIIEGMKC